MRGELADVLGDAHEEARGADVVAHLDEHLDEDVGVEEHELAGELRDVGVQVDII